MQSTGMPRSRRSLEEASAPLGWRSVQIDPEAFRFAAADGFLALEEMDGSLMDDGQLVHVPTVVKPKKRDRKATSRDAQPTEAEARESDDDAAGVAQIAAAAAAKAVAAAAAKAKSNPSSVAANEQLTESLPAKRRKVKDTMEHSMIATSPSGGDGANSTDLFAAVAAEIGANEKPAVAPLPHAKKTKSRAAKESLLGKCNVMTASDEAAEEPAKDMTAWSQFGLHERLLRNLAIAGFTVPRPIQQEVREAAILTSCRLPIFSRLLLL